MLEASRDALAGGLEQLKLRDPRPEFERHSKRHGAGGVEGVGERPVGDRVAAQRTRAPKPLALALVVTSAGLEHEPEALVWDVPTLLPL
jgi:hypothetical protein